jgi:hypothetical protein
MFFPTSKLLGSLIQRENLLKEQNYGETMNIIRKYAKPLWSPSTLVSCEMLCLIQPPNETKQTGGLHTILGLARMP